MPRRGRVRRKAKQKTADIPKNPEHRPFLAPWSGFEPLAFRLGGGRSILLSYANKREHDYIIMIPKHQMESHV